MRKLRIKPAGVAAIFIALIFILGSVMYITGSYKPILESFTKDNKPAVNNVVDNSTTNDAKQPETTQTNVSTAKPVSKDSTIRLSLDEWIGWKPIIDANGGLTTQKGSIYDQLGIKVEIAIINDATQSSNALIKGDLNAAGYTVNRLAFLTDKFTKANLSVKMPYITNYSNGGDGIISKAEIKSVSDLVGKKIGVPRFSEAQTLVEWLLDKSDLTDAQKATIEMVYFETPDDAAKAFFAGQLDAAATWEPYLSQAQDTTGARAFFTTKDATNLILDGILFRQDFMTANEDVVLKFIDGALQANDLYTETFTAIKESMPLFMTESNESIADMASSANLASYNENIDLYKNNKVQNIFVDMSNIWNKLGEASRPDMVDSIFDNSIMTKLADKYATVTPVAKPKITQEQRTVAQKMDNTEALLKISATINFEPNTAVFSNPAEADAALQDFIHVAQTLNGAVIQVEGNIADTGNGDTPEGRALSEQRATTVIKYLVQNGIDPTRILDPVGNGITKPVGDNSTEEGKAMNRRTDLIFKTIE